MSQITVFLSYSHADKIVARRIVRRLIAHGIEVWFDDRELRIGALLTSSIRKSIENADLLLVIASHTAAESDWVELELNYAREQNKYIIPLFIDPLSAHPRFKDRLGLDACSPQSFAEVVDKLVNDLYASIAIEPAPACRDTLTRHLRDLAIEEPNLAPIILGYLDGKGLLYENVEPVVSTSFHMLDESLNTLLELYPQMDVALCAAHGFARAGAGVRALLSWIGATGDGGLPLVMALGNQPLMPELIPTAIRLLGTCGPPNNHALYMFIEKNALLLDESQRRSVIRLVTWPAREDTERFGDTLAWVALKHFPASYEIQKLWVRWITGGSFDQQSHQLASHLAQAHKEQLPGWEPVIDTLKMHVRRYIRSGNKIKVLFAIDHLIANADCETPVLDILLQETREATCTAEWRDWRHRDPETADFIAHYLNIVNREANGNRDWLGAWNQAEEMAKVTRALEEFRKTHQNRM